MSSVISDPAVQADATSPAAHRFAARPVLIVAAVVATIHMAAALLPGYWNDEQYILALARHPLDWGTADQPPLTILVAAAMDAIAPGSIPVLRIPAVLATTAAVVLAGVLARDLGGDRRAQVTAAAAQATALMVTHFGHWLTPYALEPVQWLGLFALLVRWVRVRDDRLLLAAGLLLGAAVQTKFQVLALAVVLVMSVALLGPRAMLRRPMFWWAAAAATVVSAPTLVWQGLHGWPQLRMGAVVAAESGPLFGGSAGVALWILVGAGVAGAALAVFGVVGLFRFRELRPFAFVGLTVVVMYVLVVASSGRPYYLDGVYGVAAAAGAVGLARYRRPIRRWWRTAGAWTVWTVSIATAALLVLATTGSTDPGPNRVIARRALDVTRALPAEQREHAVVWGETYVIAAVLDTVPTADELPPVVSGNRAYGYLAPPGEDVDTVVFVGRDVEMFRPWFSSIRPAGDGGRAGGVWVVSGRTAPWSDIHPALRTLHIDNWG